VKAYEQLVASTKRFPIEDIHSPVAVFQAARKREIEKLRDDAKQLRSQGR
jgi:hypothetical protein